MLTLVIFSSKCIDGHTTTLICLHWLNTLRNLEGEGDKGKKDLLHESHVIMEYNIAQG